MSRERDVVLGIDLGTTNSEVAAYLDDRIQVLGSAKARMLPSCVGISPSGELLVGRAALNQHLIHPDRTVRSVKRRMGSEETVTLGEKSFTPQEISAFILRALIATAERHGLRGRRAVITVPAYFSDAQRQATREAGALAGLEVIRILNEPTAASLAYGHGDACGRTILVYDLGGGTFDVSLVTMEGDVTEVLASHGNNKLGGDDFDQLLVERLAEVFAREHGLDPRQDQPAAQARLVQAAEEAKKRLSFEPYAVVREENLIRGRDKPLHLELEITREEYEKMILPLVESTLESISKTLADAGKRAENLDAVLLVGGSTRTPLIERTLERRIGIKPRREIHPDLCVALGAGVLAARLGGQQVERVLVDISPYSFGPSHLGMRGGVPYPHCYRPIIERNTPLPVTRTERYWTSAPHQTRVEVKVFQGDDPDALKNVLVGEFAIDDLTPQDEPNEVLCRMSLDLDGILNVTATEKQTAKSKHITITQALEEKSERQLAAARRRLNKLFPSEELELEEAFSLEEAAEPAACEISRPTEEPETPEGSEDLDRPGGAEDDEPAWAQSVVAARRAMDRSRGLFDKMHAEDREEAIDVHERLEAAIASRDAGALRESMRSLRELLFFVEGS